jgi:quinol monooxygenase YgiN
VQGRRSLRWPVPPASDQVHAIPRSRAMFARHVTLHIQPDKLNEAIRIYRESVVPASRLEKGCRHMELFTDAKTGKCVSISYWLTEADQQASEANGYLQQQLDKFAALMVGQPVRESYTVSVRA